MGEPRVNEERSYVYPMKRVAAVLKDEGACTATCADLERAGVDVSDVNVLHGPEGQRLLDRTGASHGPLGRLLRRLQHGGYEGETLAAHSAALRQGAWLIFIPAKSKSETARAIDILRAHGAGEIFHFRRWAVQSFPPGYRLNR